MANPEHVAKLKEGREAWNAWRRTSDNKPDLSGISLTSTVLDDYELIEADFRDSGLTSVTFTGVNCSDSLFERATILDCHFDDALLRRASFRKADIAFTSFDWCDFDEADFTDASFTSNTFGHLSLGGAHGLGAIHNRTHNDSIGIDTFFLSGGLPESFLRSSGVTDEFVQYATSLVGKAIEYYSCFLSYTSKDDEFARRLYNDLRGKNIRTWFAPEDLKIGDRFRSRIDESIRIHDKLVLILSANSITSDWVQTEVERALERERKEGKDVLFPIAIDDDGFNSDQPWPADIRRKRHIGDFRKWKSHDDYTAAFDRLVRDLKKSQPPIIMKGG